MAIVCNDMAAKIHDRMAVILDRDAASVWLSSDAKAIEQLNALTKPVRESYLTAYAVDRRVGNPSFNQIEAVQPLSQLF